MSIFKFRYFSVRQTNSALKVGTDAMIFGASVNASDKLRALDIGAGTGVLSLIVAQRNEQIEIDAIELDEEAVQDAEYNFKKSPYSERLTAIHQDFLQFASNETYDLIFSNPPFYTDALKGDKEKLNVAKHVDGLTPNILMAKVSGLLSHEGAFWIIWPSDGFHLLAHEAESQGLYLNHKIVVCGKPLTPKRIIAEFTNRKGELSESTLTVRNEDGKYTAEYIRLTKDLHDREL